MSNWSTSLTVHSSEDDQSAQHKISAQLLRENGFETDAGNFDKESALRWAAINGHEGPVQLLLDEGAEIDAKDDKGRTALNLAAENQQEAVTLQLLEKGADAMTKGESENTVLHWAAENGLKVLVRELLRKRVNIEAKNVYKNTALHWAAWAGQEAVVRLLLDNGAAIRARGDAGLNALHRASWYGHKSVVQLLLERGADISDRDRDGKTALLWAAQYGHDRVMQVLLENRADVNEKDEDGQTALHLAALNGHELAVRLLLEHSADVEALDFGREKALDFAIRNGHHALTKLLSEPGILTIPPISKLPGELERELARYFPDSTNPLGKRVNEYEDFEIQEISRLLEQTSYRLSSDSPRIYIVLRTIGALEYVEKFINSGITDLWFPFSPEHIPQGVRPSTCEKFLEAQKLVLTAGFKLNDSKHYGLAKQHLNRDGFPKRLEWKAELGSGGFGVVFKVLGPEEYALKLIHRKRQFSQTLEVMQYFKSELEILKRINHYHFVKLVGSYTSPIYVGLVMSPVANDNLANFLLSASQSVAQRRLLWSFLGCLANALAYLHFTLKIRHKDIKPQNILVKRNVVLLTDFGMALDWGNRMQTTTRQESRRTTLYCAPEAARDEPRRSSSDIWSLGCVYLEMITVLNGHTVDDIRSFFDKNGTKVRNFWSNLEAISMWIAKFRERGGKEFENIPLGWIEMMLQEDGDRRPDARYLRDLIIDSHPEEQSSITFYGSCCAESSLEIGDSGSESEVLSQGSCDATDSMMPEHEKREELTQLLLENGFNSTGNDAQDSGRIGLHWAAEKGYDTVVRLLLERGGVVDIRNNQGRSALHFAAAHGQSTVAQLLLDNGAEIKAMDDTGASPLFCAVMNDQVAMIKLLLKNGANLNAINEYGWAPVHIVAMNGYDEVAQLLLEKNADVDVKDRNGWTPLHWAAQMGHVDIARYLLERGAKLNEKDRDGLTAVDRATKRGHAAMVQLLNSADLKADGTTRDSVSSWVLLPSSI